MRSRVEVTDDLTIKVGAEAVRLTPRAGFSLAEQLVKQSMSRLIADELASATRRANQPDRVVRS